MREALRRLVVRLIGQPSTSVPPILAPKPYPTTTSERLQWLIDYELGGKVVGFRPPEAGSEPATSQPQAGIKPPPDPATEGWTFTRWAAAIDSEGDAPGWAYVRFANCVTKADGSDSAHFVFGFVRSAFGVWKCTYSVCHDRDGTGAVPESKVLTTICHLRSGYSIGIFADMAVAMDAAELAERVHPGWRTERKPTLEGIARTMEAWDGAGICAAIDAHAHSADGAMLKINGRSMESIMDGKPERLS